MQAFSVVCDPSQTAAVAAAVAPSLQAGDAVLLNGGLAAGKTFFVQALVRALGSADEVTSPTFTIANFYRTERGPVLHVDAYRLSSVAEFRDLALEDYVAESISAVEWAERVDEEFPEALRIDFATVPEDERLRTLAFSPRGDRWTAAFGQLRADVEGALA
jgi:tRNA threonylcarbamoyladenosine biosynthesis protein TsaE